VIPASDINSVTIDPTNGDIYIDTFSQGYTVTSGGTTPPTNSVVINSFTASPSTLFEGDVVSLSWSSSNASACSGIATGSVGGWTGAVVPKSFNGLRFAIANAGTYTFTLQCSGTNGPVTRQRTVVVNTPSAPQPTSCDSTPPLSGGVTTWAAFWHIGFPGPKYDNERLRIPRTGYWALQFETGDIVDHGGLISVANTSSNGTRLGSISACPGDFDVGPECTHKWGSSGGIGWATDGQAGYCQLQANTTYYMNFTYTDGTDPTSSTCLITENCTATLQAINLQ